MTIPHDRPWVGTLQQGERKISVEVGRLGAQADGSVLLRPGRDARDP